jgi:GNAT superfamily N-acetyltransferase
MVPEDTRRVAEINVTSWQVTYKGIVSDEVLRERTVESTLVRWEEQARSGTDFGRTDKYVYDDGIVRAFLMIGKCRDEDKPDSFELGAIYVEPGFEKKGIGTVLAKFTERKARKQGYSEIVLWTLEGNMGARKFYEKMGYVPDGRIVFEEKFGTNKMRYVKKL